MRRNAVVAFVAVLAALWASAAAGKELEQRLYSKGTWRQMAFYLPGSFKFLDRLVLTEEQRELLDEITGEWSVKRAQAMEKVRKEMPMPEDAAGRMNYYSKFREAVEKASGPPPVDRIREVLTIEQLDKLDEAEQAIKAWHEWLRAELPKYEAKLNEILGPAPKDVPPAELYRYHALASVHEGTALFYRIGLSEKQRAALASLRRLPFNYSWFATSLEGTGLAQEQVLMVTGIVNAAARRVASDAAVREKIDQLLTDEQKAKLTKALAVVQERDGAIAERYATLDEKLGTLLPFPAPAAAPGQWP